MLHKVIRYAKDGVELEADPRHAELVIRELGLEGAKPSKIPGAKAIGHPPEEECDEERTEELDAAEARRY